MRYLLLLALAFPACAEVYLRAYTERDGVVCFDLPEGMVDAPPKSFEPPTEAQLKEHYFEVGRRSILPFETALPESVSKRQWLLVSTAGAVRFHPARLRGEVSFAVDQEFRRTSDPPRVSMRACAVGPFTGIPAFAVQTKSVWRTRTRPFTPPDPGPRKPGLVRTMERRGKPSLALIQWSSTGEPCEKAFSLFEMRSEGPVEVASNSYDCDV